MNESIRETKEKYQQELKESQANITLLQQQIGKLKAASKTTDKKALDRKVRQLEQQLQVEQIESQEKESTIQKLRELVDEEKKTN